MKKGIRKRETTLMSMDNKMVVNGKGKYSIYIILREWVRHVQVKY